MIEKVRKPWTRSCQFVIARCSWRSRQKHCQPANIVVEIKKLYVYSYQINTRTKWSSDKPWASSSSWPVCGLMRKVGSRTSVACVFSKFQLQLVSLNRFLQCTLIEWTLSSVYLYHQYTGSRGNRFQETQGTIIGQAIPIAARALRWRLEYGIYG